MARQGFRKVGKPSAQNGSRKAIRPLATLESYKMAGKPQSETSLACANKTSTLKFCLRRRQGDNRLERLGGTPLFRRRVDSIAFPLLPRQRYDLKLRDFRSLLPPNYAMGLLEFIRPKPRLAIGDCASRTTSCTESFPVNLSGRSHFGRKTRICRIRQDDGTFSIELLDRDKPVRLDGRILDGTTSIELDRPYGLSLSNRLIVIRISRQEEPLDQNFEEPSWDIAEAAKPEDRETVLDHELDRQTLKARYPDLQNYLAFPSNTDACFTLADLVDTLEQDATQNPEPNPQNTPPATQNPEPRTQKDAQTCPYCWKKFALGDALNIAAHASLTGDPILGQHAKLRFAAERFNHLGQALDAEGTVSIDLACPHCRGRLPPSFFSHRQLILSLVGAPSSGKSYYLSVLLRQLPEELIRQFGANLQDGDPSGNAQLNEMKNRLFSATSPEDAFISKTDFEGVMYERLYRDGQLAPLPRPFVYYLQRLKQPDTRASLVFYDNAGEHFKPGVALDDSPGALHVAASAGLLFLFDPTTHPAFRKLLRRKRDPQLRTHATDEQDTILAELGVRVKKMRGIESHQKTDTPLAIMVGKFDLWRSLLPEDALHLPETAPLTPEQLDANSSQVRQLLAQLCPTIVANAEALSSVVRYFPVSPLGHSPRLIEEGPLAGRLAPNPRRLKPLLVTTPALWILRQQAEELLNEE